MWALYSRPCPYMSYCMSFASTCEHRRYKDSFITLSLRKWQHLLAKKYAASVSLWLVKICNQCMSVPPFITVVNECWHLFFKTKFEQFLISCSVLMLFLFEDDVCWRFLWQEVLFCPFSALLPLNSTFPLFMSGYYATKFWIWSSEIQTVDVNGSWGSSWSRRS